MAGGYRLGAGGELPPLLLDDAEAVAVAVGLRTAAAGGIAGIEETSVRALTKLEQVLPGRLRRRVSALSDATSAFGVEGPQIDAEVLATLAGACRDSARLRFSYVARDERASMRIVEPTAVVYSGHRWYLVAFDLDRDDWRTFRLDRIRGRVRLGERGRRRIVPGGDPAAFVRAAVAGRLGGRGVRGGSRPDPHACAGGADPEPHTRPLRVGRARRGGGVHRHLARAWSHGFLVWMATLDEPMEVLGPPELVEAARAVVARLSAAA